MNDSQAEAIISRALEIGYEGTVRLDLIADGAFWLVVDGTEGARVSAYLDPKMSAEVLQSFL